MKNDLLFSLSMLIAFLLAVWSLPVWLHDARPAFVLLVYLYWVLALPERYGLLMASLLGLLQDLLSGGLLGTHVVLFVMATAFCQMFYRRLRMQSAWSLALVVGVLLVVYQVMALVIALMTFPVHTIVWQAVFLPGLIGFLLWPWLMVFLRGLRRRFGIVNPL